MPRGRRKSTESRSVAMSIRTTQELYELVEDRANKDGVSVSTEANKLLRIALEVPSSIASNTQNQSTEITGTKEQKLASLRALLAAVPKAQPVAQLEADPPKEWLTKCGVDKDGNREHGCGCDLPRSRWIRADGKDRKNGHLGASPCCASCMEVAQ